MTKKSYLLIHDDPDLLRKVKSKAAAEGRTIKDVILDFLRRYIKS